MKLGILVNEGPYTHQASDTAFQFVTDEILAKGFRISGLGQLVETGIEADRLVVFGD